jgi:hypothetical protein
MGELYEIIEKMIYQVLRENRLLFGEWQLGKVAEVISEKRLKVYVNGSDVAQTIPCNPDVMFSVDDEVWVIFVNGDSKNKFVLCKRAVE